MAKIQMAAPCGVPIHILRAPHITTVERACPGLSEDPAQMHATVGMDLIVAEI